MEKETDDSLRKSGEEGDSAAALDQELGLLPTTTTPDTNVGSSSFAQQDPPFERGNGVVPSNSPPLLDPCLSTGENMRDALLRFLDKPFLQFLGIVVTISLVASFLMKFFLLVGWHGLCEPRRDCDPRNKIFNILSHVLNICLKYQAVLAFPWRITNLLHTTGWACPHRHNAPGNDLYGQVTDDIWFHIPLRQRTWILVFLLGNCVSQYFHQVTRYIYHSYQLQHQRPGVVWTNLFLSLALACFYIGGFLIVYHGNKIRQTDPQRFGQGPVELVREKWNQLISSPTEPYTDGNNETTLVSVAPKVGKRPSDTVSEFDPTRSRSKRQLVELNRSSMRMFAM